jgi:hypothetical protein
MFINVTYDQADNALPVGFKSTIDQVVQFFDATFTSPATINIDVGFNEVHGQPMNPQFGGQSSFFSVQRSLTDN